MGEGGWDGGWAKEKGDWEMMVMPFRMACWQCLFGGGEVRSTWNEVWILSLAEGEALSACWKYPEQIFFSLEGWPIFVRKFQKLSKSRGAGKVER